MQNDGVTELYWKKKKRKTGLVLAITLHLHDTSKNKIGLELVSLS